MKSKLSAILREDNPNAFTSKIGGQCCYFVDSNIKLFSLLSYDSKYEGNPKKTTVNDRRYVFKNSNKSICINDIFALNARIEKLLSSENLSDQVKTDLFAMPKLLIQQYESMLLNGKIYDFCFDVLLRVLKIIPFEKKLFSLEPCYYIHLLWLDNILNVSKIHLSGKTQSKIKHALWCIVPESLRKYIVLKKSDDVVEKLIKYDLCQLSSRCINSKERVRCIVNIFDKIPYVPPEKTNTQIKRIEIEKVKIAKAKNNIEYKHFGTYQFKNDYVLAVASFIATIKMKLGISNEEYLWYLNEKLINSENNVLIDEYVEKYKREMQKYKNGKEYFIANSYVPNISKIIKFRDNRLTLINEIIELYIKKINISEKRIVYFDFIHKKSSAAYNNEVIFVTSLNNEIAKRIIPILIKKCVKLSEEMIKLLFEDEECVEKYLFIYRDVMRNDQIENLILDNLDLYVEKENIRIVFNLLLGCNVGDTGIFTKIVFVDNFFSNKIGEGEMAIFNWIVKYEDESVKMRNEILFGKNIEKDLFPKYTIISKDTDVIVCSLLTSNIIRKNEASEKKDELFKNYLYVDNSSNKNKKNTNICVNKLYESLFAKVSNAGIVVNKNNYVVESYVAAMMICGGDYVQSYYGVNQAKINAIFIEYYKLYGDLIEFVGVGANTKIILNSENYYNLLKMVYFEGEKNKQKFIKLFGKIKFEELEWNKFEKYMQNSFVNSKFKLPPTQEILQQQIRLLEWNLQYYLNICFDVVQPNGIVMGCYKYIDENKGYISGNVVYKISPNKMERKKRVSTHNNDKNEKCNKKTKLKK